MAEDLNEKSLRRVLEEAAKTGPLNVNPTRVVEDSPLRGNVLNGGIYGPAQLTGDGVELTSIETPPGLIDNLADAIRSGKLKPQAA